MRVLFFKLYIAINFTLNCYSGRNIMTFLRWVPPWCNRNATASCCRHYLSIQIVCNYVPMSCKTGCNVKMYKNICGQQHYTLMLAPVRLAVSPTAHSEMIFFSKQGLLYKTTFNSWWDNSFINQNIFSKSYFKKIQTFSLNKMSKDP